MNIFELFAKLSLDSSEYEKGIGSAQKETSSFASKLKSGLATAAKVTATAMMVVGTAATAATVKLAKEAVSAYADYEQLVGGVETLFADSAKLVQSYAANAYKTAGLSANEYMETVTSFSASLLQSLGGDTERAANVADMAIRDMSDNANKMGSSMESIQTAYQGFAKQNYTMLDNLKLGYGGTKSEMERLILDAESLSDTFTASRDENGDLAMSYADIVDAIHIVQDEMGITGTTAKEASATIAGSVSAAKSAWQNLVAGLANENADMTSLIDNFVESVGTAGKNILPRVEKALQGVGKLVSSLGPIIAKSAPGIIKSVAPTMISAISDVVVAITEQLPEISTPILESLIAVALEAGGALAKQIPAIISSLVQNIKSIAKAISRNIKPILKAVTSALVEIIGILTDPGFLPDLIQAGLDMLMALVDGLLDALPQLIAAVPPLITGFINAIVANLPMIIDCGIQLIKMLIDGLIENLPALMDAAIEIILALVDALTNPDTIIKLAEAALQLVIAIGKGLIEALPTLIEKVPKLIMGLYDALIANGVKLLKAGRNIIDNIANGIDEKWDDVKQWAKDITGKIGESFLKTWETVKTWGKDIIDKIRDGISTKWPEVKTWAVSVIAKIGDGLLNVWEDVKRIGKDIVRGIWEGIKSMASWIGDQVSGFFSGLIGDAKAVLGISSPSKVFASIGAFTAEGFGLGFDKAFAGVADDVQSQMDALTHQTVSIDGKGSTSGMVGTLNKVEALLTEIRDKDTMIVLDDGTIVGRVDKMLGQTTMWKARGNA